MKRLTRVRAGVLIAMAALLAIALVGPASVQAEGADTDETVLVDLRIWQNVRDAEDIWVSARLAEGDWDELGTSQVQFDEDQGGGFFWPYYQYRYGDLTVGDVVLSISQSLDKPELIYASACSYPPVCGLILVPLDDGHNRSRTFRYGETTLAVPIPSEAPAEDERPLLLEDRDNLLALRDRLAGWERTLNWHPAVPMDDWSGVMISGTPPRVTRLHLPDRDLRGRLSGLIGELTGLTELRLEGNRLDGPIPSKLLQLKGLTHLYLGGNPVEGCIPPPLWTVPNNDLESLGLDGCPLLLDISYDEHILGEGTYRLGNIVFDIPSGLRLRLDGFVLNEGAPDAYILRSLESHAWIAIAGGAGTYRWTQDGLFDRIVESMWEATEDVLSRWEQDVLSRWVESLSGDWSGTLPLLSMAPRPFPRLTVLSDGALDALILEWFGAPEAAIKWQYRQGVGEPNSRQWGDWTDIPGSEGDTRSYRVEGLQSGQQYFYQVRAVETLEGLSSPRAEGTTQAMTGIPVLNRGQVVVGDGVTEWRFPASDYVVTIPEGLRARRSDWAPGGIAILGEFGEAGIMFDVETGAVLSRSYAPDLPDSANALLDQIVASLRKLSVP